MLMVWKMYLFSVGWLFLLQYLYSCKKVNFMYLFAASRVADAVLELTILLAILCLH